MKKIIVYTIIVLCVLVSTAFIYKNNSKTSLTTFASSISFEKNNVYLFLRGSNTKMGGFAKQYNRFNKNATHVAIGIMKDSLSVFHVNTEKLNNKHLRIESLKRFIDNDEYDYFALWRLTNLTQLELQYIESKIKEFSSQEILFDFTFNSESNDKLYCSEFVYKALNNIPSKKFKLPLSQKKVPKEHLFFLKKDSLKYYPTDFFFQYKNIKKIDEWSLEK